ncbi:cytochrome P450 86B1, partial [Phalaenopsis equestris]|uniref:cytochrome P450 86B1 n=1 Tax=Phalaenopsis equestris TaxID=78828 RepID=UPI0009E53546
SNNPLWRHPTPYSNFNTSMALLALISFLLSHLKLADIGVGMLILFLSSSAIQWLTGKGPMQWPLLGNMPSFAVHIHHVYDWGTQTLVKAGGTFPFRGVMFARFYGVVTADPSNLEYILKTNFSNFPKGRYYRERFVDFLGDGIFNADDAVWRDQRRAATAEMHTSRFVEYSADTIRELVYQKLLPLLRRLAENSTVVDLQDVFLRFTFDNICTAAFGVDPGCLAADLPEVPFAKAFEEATRFTLFRFLVPPPVWKIMKVLDVGTERRLRIAIRSVHEFAEKTVRDRKADLSFNERSDLLSRLISSEQGFSDKFLKDFCISFILAGRDTSSVALAWFFWLLYKHPRVERKILAEILAIIKQRGVAAAGFELDEVVFTVDEVKRMDYLQAALTESLRLYPSVPLDFKQALEDDVLPDGTRIRKGGRVIYLIYAMGRMEGIWGKDCMEFRPERWLKKSVFTVENPFKYVVFNAGPRLCVGKKFAYMQMKMVVAAMLLRYKVVVEEGQEVVPRLTTTLYMRDGLKVTVERRKE